MPSKERDSGWGSSNGDIWVTDIDTDTAIDFCDAIKEKYRENPTSPIIIYINSGGGCVDAMFSMMDAMDNLKAIAKVKTLFITVVSGKAMSAGCDLLAHGDLRIAHPNSRIMAHQTSAGAFGHIDDMVISVEETERMNDQATKIFAENINFKGGLNKLKKLLTRDVYFTPKEAKEFGVIDKIGYVEVASVNRTVIELIETDRKKRKKKGE